MTFQKDFIVGQSNELVQRGQVYDLHNFYDFHGLGLDPLGGVCLRFVPSSTHGDGHLPVEIQFSGVSRLVVKGDSEGKGIGVDLDEIGYLPTGQESVEWLMAEGQSDGSCLVFRFSGGEIRIGADRATLVVVH